MKKFLVILVAGLMVLSIMSAESYAGPWTLKQGKVYTEVFTRYSWSKYCYDPEWNLSRWDKHAKQEIWDLEGKLEVGLLDNLNFLLGVPYAWSFYEDDISIHAGNNEIKNQGYKRINVGLKYKLFDEPLVTAVQAKWYINNSSVDRFKQPVLDEWGHLIDVRGLVGKSFTLAERPSYFSVESGIKLPAKRMPNGSDWATTIPIFAECGFSPHDRVMLKTEFDCNISIPGTGQIKDTYIWRIGPIINLLGNGFGSIQKGEDASVNIELLYGWTFAGRGDKNVHKDPSWPNSDDRIGALHELIAKVQILF